MTLLTESQLQDHGVALGQRLPPGSVVLFRGEVGAGKTTFIKSIARGLGVSTATASPTFALVHRYPGLRGPVFHVDCYRLRSSQEARDLDWEGMVDEGDAILIEWPDQAGPWLPPASHQFTLSHVEDPAIRCLEGG